MRKVSGVTPSGPGLRPSGAEPAAQSQAEPLVPNADDARLLALANALFRRAPEPANGEWLDFFVRATKARFTVNWVLYGLWEGEPFVWGMGAVGSYATEATANARRDDLRAVMIRMGRTQASAIETGTGKTREAGLDAQHESAVGNAETPNPNQGSPS